MTRRESGQHIQEQSEKAKRNHHRGAPVTNHPPPPAGDAGLVQQLLGHIRTITPEEAALAQVTTLAIYRWVEAGELHFAETPEGALLICPDSLKAEWH